MILIDVFPHDDHIHLWVKENGQNKFLKRKFCPEIFFIPFNKYSTINKFNLFNVNYNIEKRKIYLEISEFDGIFDKTKYTELMKKAMKRVFFDLSLGDISDYLNG